VTHAEENQEKRHQ